MDVNAGSLDGAQDSMRLHKRFAAQAYSFATLKPYLDQGIKSLGHDVGNLDGGARAGCPTKRLRYTSLFSCKYVISRKVIRSMEPGLLSFSSIMYSVILGSWKVFHRQSV